MKIRKLVLSTVAVLVGLPLLLVLGLVVSISILDRTNGRIVLSGETREYLLYVPESYDPATPAPLVISIHGGAGWPAQQRNLSRWNRLADEHGFLVVYPAGTPQILGIVRIWQTFRADADLERDVRFISALIDTLQATYTIDSTRIYANGISNGGGMAFVLSCTMADRIAAVGMVAPAQAMPPGWCAPSRPVPVIAFHGTGDPIVPYEGGELGDRFNPVKQVFPAVRDFVAEWAARNGCALDPVESPVVPTVSRLEYPNCTDGAAVVLYSVSDGGHTWPGGKPLPKWWVGPTSNAIDATGEMWAFFREHPLARATGR